MAEFNDKWNNTHLLNNEIINLYSNKLNFAIERWDMDYDLSKSNVEPNFMQRKALKELNRYRAVGTNRALVVAAAGFRVIIVTVANSLGNIRVFELLPKLKTKKYGWCIA